MGARYLLYELKNAKDSGGKMEQAKSLVFEMRVLLDESDELRITVSQ